MELQPKMRVGICANGQTRKMAVGIWKEETVPEFLERISPILFRVENKLGKRLLKSNGEEIEDLKEIEFDELLVISCGEDFVSEPVPNQHSLEVKLYEGTN
jgi:hypothetical protein